jgi:DNA-binding HxlR family transcriptional regulator
MSKVLRSLAKDNLVAKRSDGIGRRNAWRLTPRGEELLPALARQGG